MRARMSSAHTAFAGLLVAASSAALVGCGPGLFSLDAEQGWKKLAESRADEPKERAPGPAIPFDIVVALQSTPSVGCLMRDTTNSPAEKFGSIGGECESIPADNEETHVKQAMKKAGANGAAIIKNFAPTLAGALQRKLARRFRTARVNVTSAATPAAQFRVTVSASYYMNKSRFGDRRTFIALTAVTAAGEPVVGRGEGRDNVSSGHLAWALPVMILLMPIGTMVGAMTLPPMDMRAREASVAQAVDGAAERLASQLAAAHRRRGAPPPPATVPNTPAQPTPSASQDDTEQRQREWERRVREMDREKRSQ